MQRRKARSALILVYLLAAICLPLWGQTPNPTTAPTEASQGDPTLPEGISAEARAAVEKGVEHLEAKQFKEAINAFLAAARRHPNNGQFRHLLGFAYAQNKQLPQAWLQFRKAVRFNPQYPDANRDFLTLWNSFDRSGVLNVGTTPEQVQKVLGKADGEFENEQRSVLEYGYMRLNFLNGRLFSIVDPRGLDPQDNKPVDSLRARLDDKARWRLGYRAVNRLQTVTEYVPEGQQVQKWKELFTVQRLHRLVEQKTTPEQLMGRIQDQLKQIDPKMTFQVVSKTGGSVLFQWQDPGAKGRPAQHEIVRLVAGKKDIHRLAYSKRVKSLSDEDTKKWIGLLQQAELLAP